MLKRDQPLSGAAGGVPTAYRMPSAHDPRRPDSGNTSLAVDTVGHTHVKIFHTLEYRHPSRDDSRQYEADGRCRLTRVAGAGA